MSNGAETAVRIAKNVGEIGFPEFTAKLITDTFDALISANMRQTEAYMELMSNVSKDLTTFINDTKDDISGEMVLDFLIKIMPEGSGTRIRKNNQAVLGTDAQKLNETLEVKDNDGTTIEHAAFTSDQKVSDVYQEILEAAAKRLAANKYTYLMEMIKMGMLRLVVEKGLIETRLTFNTYGYSYDSEVTSEYNRQTSRSGGASGIIQTILTGPKTSANTMLKISTANEKHYDTTGSSVQIFGMVQLNFKTDYMPLSS